MVKKMLENSGLSQALIAPVPPMNPGIYVISLRLYVKLDIDIVTHPTRAKS